MLEVANLSDFALLTFGALDTSDEMSDVVVAKGSYALKPIAQSDRDPEPRLSLQPIFDEKLTCLFVEDEFCGAVNQSSVRTESDLAPFKPKCDVILLASAYSPSGPTREMVVRIDIDRGTRRIHTHRLRVVGKRDLVRRDAFERAAASVVRLATLGSVEAPAWYLGEPEPFTECTLRYELAFGGALRVSENDDCADLHPCRVQAYGRGEAKASGWRGGADRPPDLSPQPDRLRLCGGMACKGYEVRPIFCTEDRGGSVPFHAGPIRRARARPGRMRLRPRPHAAGFWHHHEVLAAETRPRRHLR